MSGTSIVATRRPPLLAAASALGGFVIAYFLFSSYWWVFLIIGCCLTALSFFIREPEAVPQGKNISIEEAVGMKAGAFVIPQNWNPDEIGIQIRSLQHDSSLVRVFVSSVVNRFVIGQDNRTAKVRIDFLKTKLEELTLSKELQASLDELKFRDLSLDIKELELETQKSSLQMQQERHKEISDLERQRDALKIKLEMASLEKQMKDLQNPNHQPPQRTAEEIRKENKEKIEQKLAEYDQQEKDIQASSRDEDSKQRLRNIIAKKKDELYGQLEKYL